MSDDNKNDDDDKQEAITGALVFLLGMLLAAWTWHLAGYALGVYIEQ